METSSIPLIIGKGFFPFLWLTIIAVAVSLIMRYAIKSRLIAGYPSELIFAWLGAWLGTPVFGRWIEPIAHKEVYFIPAIIGSFAALYFVIGAERLIVKVWGEKESSAATAETE